MSPVREERFVTERRCPRSRACPHPRAKTMRGNGRMVMPWPAQTTHRPGQSRPRALLNGHDSCRSALGRDAVVVQAQRQTSTVMPGRASSTWVPSRSPISPASASRALSSPWTNTSGGCPAKPPYHSISPRWSACADSPPTVWIFALTRKSRPWIRAHGAPLTSRRPSVPSAW